MRETFRTFSALLTVLALSITFAFAGKREDYQKTYNYVRAMELVDGEKYDEAISYLNREIADHKDNGYAMAWLASLYLNAERAGDALSMINKAMKHIAKKDSYYEFCLRVRWSVYQTLGNNVHALSDMNECIKLFPKEKTAYEDRASFFLKEKQFEDAHQDFLQLIKIDEGDAGGYMGCAICLRNMKFYEDAIDRAGYAIKLNPQYSAAYTQRAYCYMLTKRFNDAADDIVKSLDIESTDGAFALMEQLADSAFDAIDFKLKIYQMMQPTEVYWPYCRAEIRYSTKQYKDAATMFEQCKNMKYSNIFVRRKAECLEKMGDFATALDVINGGLSVDSVDSDLFLEKVRVLNELGCMQEAVTACTRLIEMEPRWFAGYHKRGWIKDNMGDTDGAIEDYTMSIMVDDKYVYNYLSRGNMYLRKGLSDLAKADFEQVLKRDTVPSEYEGAYYAWLALGERDKAVAAMDSALVHDSIGRYYDAACLYSRMNVHDTALAYLQKALNSGFVRFSHIEHDDDLDNIRELEEFKAMIEQAKIKNAEKWGLSTNTAEEIDMDTIDYVYKTDEIPFTHEGGVTKVRCKINDLPLHFVFDTGASDVSISSVEATFMLKNGYLSEKDITGKASYIDAQGNISQGTTINLRKVAFGNLELKNVRASVVNNQKAPLLLGQSVLQRLGSIEIDNNRNILKVMQKEKVNRASSCD